MNKKIHSFEQWMKISEKERLSISYSWNVYTGEGLEIAEKVLQKFREEYSNVPKLKIIGGISNYHGAYVIPIEHPFVFDRRKFPNTYLGIEVKGSHRIEDLPKEFQVKDNKKEYVWALERYEKFVDRCENEIKKELGNPDMSRKEILDALIGGDYEEFTKQYKKQVQESIIPKYADTDLK